MKFSSEIWWDNFYGPSSLVSKIKTEINNKKNIIINCNHEIPWMDYLFELISEDYYDFKIDSCDLSCDELPNTTTILKEILELNGLGDQYKGDKNSIKYLNDIDSKYIKLYFIKNIPFSRVDELVNLMKNMSNKSKVIIIATLKNLPIQGGSLKVIKYNDYITNQDNIRFLKLVTQKSNISNYINDYIAELVGRLECSLEKAIGIFSEYHLNKTIKYEKLNEEQKKLVWEAQLLVFFPLLEKKRNDFIKKYYDKIMVNLPVTDIFDNVYDMPEELEIGHIMRLIKFNKINIPNQEREQFELYYNVRNKLAHQKIVDEEVLMKIV